MLEEWFLELMRLKNEGLAEGAKKGYSMNAPLRKVFGHFEDEWDEFCIAFNHGNWNKVLKELADLSNMCDLLFEELYNLRKGRR